jgi:hypothetical protein
VTVPFPSVATINTQHIGVSQWVDTLKLGVNYRFNWFEWLIPWLLIDGVGELIVRGVL